MMKEWRVKYIPFIIALVIVGLTLFLMVGVYFNVFQLRGYFEQSDYHHWLTGIGTSYIAIVTPAYYLLKRRYLNHFKTFLNIHVYGNLLAMMLISIHFSEQVSSPPQEYPSLGTGVVLYAAVIILVGTGFLLRFRQPKKFGEKSIRFIHTAVTISFYLIIFVHILHGINII
jgi:hypothetical protein